MDAEFNSLLHCLFVPKRYKVLYGGRSAGRSWGCARALLLIGTERSIKVLCARELQKSISESVHKLLSDQIAALGLSAFYEIQVGRIIGRNGTTFTFEGIKNNINKIKSYEGIDYCWVEEANNVSKASWNVLIPTIRKAGSEIWITFNPELETDYTYVHFVKAIGEGRASTVQSVETDQAFVVKMTWRDNPWLTETTKREIEALRQADYDQYLNVWEGFCLQMLEGVVYAKELRRAQTEGRICSVPYDRTVPVDCFWDLGRADNTSIWFVQRVAMQWRLLAYYEESGEDITHFLRELQSREYVYGTMFLPHDAKAKLLGSKKTIEEIVRGSGKQVKIVQKLSISDGINAARMVLPNCWFDEDGCSDGIKALRHYRYKVEEGQLSKEPLHDWASDGADAFRYFAVGSREPRDRGGVLTRLATAALGEQAKRSREREVSDAGGRNGPGLGWMG